MVTLKKLINLERRLEISSQCCFECYTLLAFLRDNEELSREAFGELKLMEGSSKIVSLIARDESQHLAITQNIIILLRSSMKRSF